MAGVPLPKPLGALGLVLALACAGSKQESAEETATGETAQDSPGDTETGDSPADTGQAFELGAPLLATTLDGSPWESVDGYWVELDDESRVRAELELSATSVQILQLVLEGSAARPGEYAVAEVSWVEQKSQAGDVLHYAASDPPGLTFRTLGFADGDFLFGELVGEAELDDELTGGRPVSLVGGTVESWPHY